MKSTHFFPPRRARGSWRRAAGVALGLSVLALATSRAGAEEAPAAVEQPATVVDSYHYERAKRIAAPDEVVVPTSRPSVLAIFKPTTAHDGAPVVAPETPEGVAVSPSSVLFLDANGLPAVQRPANWREQLGLDQATDYPTVVPRSQTVYQPAPNPSGGEMVTVDRSFHPFLFGRLNAAGNVEISCAQGEALVAEPIAAPAAPPAERSPMAALLARRAAAQTTPAAPAAEEAAQ